MEKLSKEELLQAHKLDGITGAKTELLSRLSRLEELEKQVADLACCGNCARFLSSACPIRKKSPECYQHCSKWQSDERTREEREE